MSSTILTSDATNAIHWDEHREIITKTVVRTLRFSAGMNSCGLISVLYYLRSWGEFAGVSVSELESLTVYAHRIATEQGMAPHECAEDLVARAKEHYLNKEKHPLHLSIDAAIIDARDWLSGADVPAEIAYICQTMELRSRSRFAVICIAYALQQRLGDDWYLAGEAFAAEMRKHGYDLHISGRDVRRILQKMRERGLIVQTEGYVCREVCGKSRFNIPDDVGAVEMPALRGGYLNRDPEKTDKWLGIYSGSLPGPVCGLESLADAMQGRKANFINQRPRSTARLRGDGDRYANADAADVKMAAEGRWGDVLAAAFDVRLSARRETADQHKGAKCLNCGGKDKMVVYKDSGGACCYKCGNLGSDGFAVLMAQRVLTFAEAVKLVATYLDVPGKVRTANPAPDLTVELKTIMGEVAELKGMDVDAMLHYGARPDLHESTMPNGYIQTRAAVRIPMRTPDLRQTSYLDIGTDSAAMQKGMCPASTPAEKSELNAYLPNDYDEFPMRPVVLIGGPKDTIAAYSQLGDLAYCVGLQDDGRVPESVIPTLTGRRVLNACDCDDSARKAGAAKQMQLLREGIKLELVELDASRHDGESVRELGVEAIRAALNQTVEQSQQRPMAQMRDLEEKVPHRQRGGDYSPGEIIETCNWIDSVWL